MVEFEPRLVALTCLYLASKAEESIVQARNLVFYIKRLCNIFCCVLMFKLYEIPFNLHFWHINKDSCFVADPDEYKYELKDILGMEMKVLEALNYYLVVFHPYRSLSEYVLISLICLSEASNLNLFVLFSAVSNREEMVGSVNGNTCKICSLPIQCFWHVFPVIISTEIFRPILYSLVRVYVRLDGI